MEGMLLRAMTCAAIVAILSGAAWAEPIQDSFGGDFQGANEFVGGEGTGWEDGMWIHYDEVTPDWWNQWFYDHPPDPTRWKEISYDILVYIEPHPDAVSVYGTVELALNWSDVDFPETGPDGPPPWTSQEQFIHRDTIATIDVAIFPPDMSPMPEPVFGDYEILPFNPEWISIDVRVDAWQDVDMTGSIVTLPLEVIVGGDIWHECVPEPATLGLLGLGLIGLATRRKRQ